MKLPANKEYEFSGGTFTFDATNNHSLVPSLDDQSLVNETTNGIDLF